MNKELIKQLEGVGFEERKNYEGCFRLRLKKYYHFDYYDDDTFYCYFEGDYVEGLKGSYDSPTFPQVLAAIKEHTGVDLTKKTKHEEIEELKVRLGKMEDAIKSQNDAIEANRKDAHRANDRLTMVLRRLKVLGVWKDEEPNKHASEMQAEEKKGFEVGDRGVLKNAKGLESYVNVLNVAISDLLTCTIDEVEEAGFWVRIPNSIDRFWFVESELEHAPAESPKQFAKIINEDARYPLQEGELVEVVSESNIGATVKRTDKNLSYFYKYSDLEFIKEVSVEPKEKALEFGDPV